MGDVIDLRTRKKIEIDTRERITYVPKLDSKITVPPLSKGAEEDFGARMQRIRDSLERINQLMAELRKTYPQDRG